MDTVPSMTSFLPHPSHTITVSSVFLSQKEHSFEVKSSENGTLLATCYTNKLRTSAVKASMECDIINIAL
jgi:hypothetical protein